MQAAGAAEPPEFTRAKLVTALRLLCTSPTTALSLRVAARISGLYTTRQTVAVRIAGENAEYVIHLRKYLESAGPLRTHAPGA